jgi:Fur family transcriptional regulator, ferric uptake regulator
MKHTLEHHKLKKTTNREVVLEILEKAAKPLSVDDIFVLAKKSKAYGVSKGILKSKTPDLVTIYRTLETFTYAGIVKEVLFKDRTTRYEIVDEHGGHCHHAICNSCGASEHVDDPEIEKTLQALAKKFKYIKKVDEHVLEFFGVCKSCTSSNSKTK